MHCINELFFQQASSSDSDTTTSTVYVTTDEEKELYRRKTMTLENDYKILKSKNYELTEELTSSREQVASLQEKLKRYEAINMKLQERLLDMPSECCWVLPVLNALVIFFSIIAIFSLLQVSQTTQ